jgi:hypothetical protein
MGPAIACRFPGCKRRFHASSDHCAMVRYWNSRCSACADGIGGRRGVVLASCE